MDNTIFLLMISLNIFTDGGHFDRIQEHFKMAALVQGLQNEPSSVGKYEAHSLTCVINGSRKKHAGRKYDRILNC